MLYQVVRLNFCPFRCTFSNGWFCVFPSHTLSFGFWSVVVHPCFISSNDVEKIGFRGQTFKILSRAFQALPLVLRHTLFSHPMCTHFSKFEVIMHYSMNNSLRPHLHRNTNRTRMWHAKTMRMFDVDVFLRRGKQHSAARWMFGEQSNAIRQMSVLQKKFAYDTLDVDVIFFYIRQWQVSNAANLFALMNKQPGNRIYSMPWRMPNKVQIYLHKRMHRFHMLRSRSRSDVNPA